MYRNLRGIGALGMSECPSGYTYDGSQCQPDFYNCITPYGERGLLNASGGCDLILKPSPYVKPKTTTTTTGSTPTSGSGGTSCPPGQLPNKASPTGCAVKNWTAYCTTAWGLPGVVSVDGQCEEFWWGGGSLVNPQPWTPGKNLSCQPGWRYEPSINPDKCIPDNYGAMCNTPAGPGVIDESGKCKFLGAGLPCQGGTYSASGACIPSGGTQPGQPTTQPPTVQPKQPQVQPPGVQPKQPQVQPPGVQPSTPVAQAGIGKMALIGAVVFALLTVAYSATREE